MTPSTPPSRLSWAADSLPANDPKNNCLRTPLSAVFGIGSEARTMQVARKRSSRHKARRVSSEWSITLIGTMLISLIGDHRLRPRWEWLPANRTGRHDHRRNAARAGNGSGPQRTNDLRRLTCSLPPNTGRQRRGDVTLMQVGAPVRNAANEIIGAHGADHQPDE